jgi:Transposase DDE domain
MQYTVTPREVHFHATQVLLTHLALVDYRRTCPVAKLLAVVFAACQRLTSLFLAAKNLRGVPSPETVRKALRANLPAVELLEQRLNRALRDRWPRALRKRRQRRFRLAIDLTLIPYHGRPLRDVNELYRGQVKSGTTHFHAYATAYLILHGQRYTAALSWVRQGEALAAVVKRLLADAARAGVRPSLLLLDRGFYAVDVLRYLQAARYPFLMPVPIKGRKADHPKGPGGTRVFALWRHSGFATYRLSPSRGRRATVGICVHCRNRRGRRGKHGRERLVYAFWGFRPPAPAAVSERYRRRFGIESSYRQLNQARPRTCTRDPRVRLFLVGVSLVLRNLWVWLHAEILAVPGRGGRRRVNLGLLRFKELLLYLFEVVLETVGRSTPPPTQALASQDLESTRTVS